MIGTWLATHPRLRRGELVWLAGVLGVTPRTLRNWRSAARRGLPPRPPGPARRPIEEWWAALRAVRRVWRKLCSGHDGWRSVVAALVRRGLEVPVGLVQELVALLKHRRAKREQQRIEAARVQAEMRARDVLWPVDETHLGRDEEGETRALVVREARVPKTLSIAVGPPATAEDVERQLERTAEERGGWPLVVGFDNGGCFRAQSLQERLAKEQVVALYNLPHTPQHNARAERGIGDLRRAAGLPGPKARRAAPAAQRNAGSAALAEQQVDRPSLLARLLFASSELDGRTARYALDGLTPDEVDRIAPRADDLVSRARFYADACAALESVARQQLPARARRRAEREAIWCTLEQHGLVQRTRGGGRIVPTLKAEEFV